MKMIGRFREDISTTSIGYKKYSLTSDDLYPTFSFCLKGDHLYKYNESSIFEAYGIYSNEYEMLLEGKSAYRYEYSPKRRLYKKIPLPFTLKTDFTFEDMAHNLFGLSQIVMKNKANGTAKDCDAFDRKLNISPGESYKDQHPFYVSYQSPKLVCFTQKSITNTETGMVKNDIYMDISYLNPNTIVDMFIHYPGQLMRNFDNPSLESAANDIRDSGLQIKVSQGTVLRKRPVKKQRCLKDVDDYDLYLQKALSDKLRCIPPFWMHRMKGKLPLEECTTLEKLKEVNSIISNLNDSMLAEFQPPCLDMFNAVVWNSLKSWNRCENHSFVQISYVDKFFMEITQVEDFGFQDFISNLGGFIGIFLGYSMMQIPELLCKSQMTINEYLNLK